MLSLPISAEPVETPQKKPDIPEEWRSVLNALRLIALECRVAAQTDLVQACALLSESREVARDAYARALIKCLRQAVGTKVTFFRPGTEEVSFDEAWLVQLLASHGRGDTDSFLFLIRSRVARQHQRLVAFLITGFSDKMS